MVCDIISADVRLIGRVNRAIMRGHAEIRRALEQGEVRGLLCQQRRALNARRARADDCNALALGIDRFMRPASGLHPAAFKRLNAVNFWSLGYREPPDSREKIAAPHFITAICLDDPLIGGLVKGR